MQTSDGAVIPSYLDLVAEADAPSFFDDLTLKLGEVTAVHHPDDASNKSGQFTEYTVMVWRRQADASMERVPYRCMASEDFGAMGDHSRFVLRASTGQQDGQPLSNGATVLIGCVNGDTSNAYIIKAVPHPKRQTKDPLRKEGRAGVWAFNGVEVDIKDDGSLVLQVQGATTNEGKPDPAGQSKTTTITVAADGDVTVEAPGNLRWGSKEAREQVVLGNQLVSALQQLINIFTQTPIIGGVGSPAGIPVVTSAALVAQLKAWVAQYLTAGPFLANRQFTEKG